MANVYTGAPSPPEHAPTLAAGSSATAPHVQARSGTVLSHWYKLFENFAASPLEFYASVEAALKPRDIPQVALARVDWHEAGLFSTKREYLRVSRGTLNFDICGAPFGRGFFFSWWLTETLPHGLFLAALFFLGTIILLFLSLKVFGLFFGLILTVGMIWFLGYLVSERVFGPDDAVLAMPLIGPLYERIFKPNTYYKMDTALMFQSAVHAAVLEVIDGMTQARGVRALSELERKPILKEFFAR